MHRVQTKANKFRMMSFETGRPLVHRNPCDLASVAVERQFYQPWIAAQQGQ
jgi:hypothetical protein